MKLSYLGHSCFQIHFGGKILLTDPFISGNGLLKDVNVDDIEADYILLSHAHQDHILDVERIAKRTGATIISCAEIAYHYSNLA
ncbi:MAG TPA: MBL fold metallo-hydrolase, partial [Saprospiraceae bacterium]|nr:MBL fold metallo-hydrolase [Saprospiraceae bacterium]